MAVRIKPILNPLLITLAAFGLQLLLWPVVKPLFLFFFFPAVFLSAWLNGLRGALASSLLSALLGLFFFISPQLSFDAHDPMDFVATGIFLLLSCALGIFFERLNRLEQDLKSRNEELEEVNKKLLNMNAELEESEKKYREVVRKAPAGIYDIDFSTMQMTDVNDTMSVVTGYSREELLTMNAMKLLDEESRNLFQSRFRIVSQGGKQSENVIFNVVKKDGGLIHVLLTIKYRHKDGQVAGASVIAHDISDRYKAEQLLKESEERLRFALETSKSGAWDLNLENQKAFRSPEHDRIFGYTESPPIWTFGMFLSHVLEEDREKIEREFTHIMDSQSQVNVECRIRRVDGEIRWIWAAGRQYGQNPKRIAGILQDITERKQAEAELRKAQKKLDIALENANIGVWEWNFDLNEVSLDNRAEKIFGFKEGEFSSSSGSFDQVIAEEELSFFQQRVKAAIAKNITFETIVSQKRCGNETRYINLKGFSSLEDGQHILTGVCFDITDLKTGSEKLILKLNEELLRSNNDLQQFAYVASHDLQEPLRMISSFTQLLQLRYQDKLDRDANDYIGFAVDGSKRLYELLNGLLSYSRIQSKGKEFGKVNMTEIADRVRLNLRLIIDEKKAKLTFPDLPSVKADENQMLQLLQNLIENALKFSPGKPEITIFSKETEEELVFGVSDKGIGIDPRYFEKIFRIFQRLHPTGEYPGTGIGLAICKRIIDRHGGKIWVESVPGIGSTFCFTIPKLKSPTPAGISAESRSLER